ncbi:MAG TPA: hypothetical protein VIT45_10710 [Allosphingosinicella sp.]
MKTLAIAAALAAQPAPVPPPQCVPQADVADMALYYLPAIYRTVAEKCRAALPADAYLVTGASAYFDRIAAQRDSRWPGARRAFVKIIGTSELPKEVTDESLRSLSDAMLAAKLSADLKTEHCSTIDEYAELLAPLPPENMAKVVALTGALATKDDKKGKSRLAICSDSGR